MSELNLSAFIWSVADNLRSYIQGFSAAVRDIFEHLDFHVQIDDLTPMTEVSGVALGFVLGHQLGQQLGRNLVAELAKDADLPSG